MAEKPKLLTERYEDFSARLDWRFQRALALFGDNEDPVVGFDDVFTVHAWRFIKAFQATGNISQRQLLRAKYPHEVRTYDYFLNNDNRRLKLEAMCLCPDLAPKDIAGILDEHVEVINLFEKFFFDIRDRKRDAVYNTLFPPNVFKEILGGDISDKIWKFFAMVGGFRMLNCLINPYTIDASTVNDFVTLGKRQVGVDYGISRLLQPLKSKDDLRDLTDAVLRMAEIDLKEREGKGDALPEGQALILKKCIEATHVQVMSPDHQLDGAYELTVEELLARDDAVPVPVG